MDHHSLKTASKYVNNLLLARGLLRNGTQIEFAKPSKGEGGTEATMAQIINVVHDLILRRDREQEQRETLVQTIRSLRSEATRNTSTAERLEAKIEDSNRQLSLSQSQERAAKAASRTAEAAAKALREEVLRLKTTAQQVRTACANDVRKRDVQIQKLKSHLTAQQRGNKTGLVGASISITPGVTGMGAASDAARDEDVPELDDPEYTLKQETTEFLTQLSQSLSDENDNLIGLVRSTLATVRELQGLPGNPQPAEGSSMSQIPAEESVSTSMVRTLPTSYEALATDMEGAIDSLRSLLTNPNFVPIDEVTVREEEIVRLRAGFERLEGRWQEAIALMNSWRERMVNGGDTVNLDELKVGLGLGIGLGASVMLSNDADSSHSEGIAEESAELGDLDLDSIAEEDELPPEPSPNVLQLARPVSRAYEPKDVRLPPLQEANGNGAAPKKVSFTPAPLLRSSGAAMDENTSEVDLISQEPAKSMPKSAPELKQTASRLPRKVRFEDGFLAIHDPDVDNSATITTYTSPSFYKRTYVDPLQTPKRHSSPERHPEERSPKLTVQEKLNIVQAEAEAAAAAVDKASNSALDKAAEARGGARDDAARRGSPRKTKIGGRPKRRKSTLTRDEFADMLVGLI